MKHENNFQWFDFFRGIAAVVVLIGHARALTFNDYASEAVGPIGKVFYFITGFGHQAVVVFFVLSGFFIIRSIHESTLRSEWSFGDYAINRLVRLWLVLFPALVMTFILDSAGMNAFEDSKAYLGKIPFMRDVSPMGKLGIPTFLGNLFFVQTILVKTYGSNGALWSLANEFWYYVLFPLVYFALRNGYTATTRIGLLLLAIGVAYLIGKDILLYSIIWLGGGVLYLISKRDWVSKWWMVCVVGILFAGVLTGIRLNKLPMIFNDYTLGVVTVLFLASLLNRQTGNGIVKALSKFFSEISYSVYVAHLPLVVLLSSFFESRLAPGPRNFLVYGVVVAVSLGYCWIMYFLFERNTNYIKKYVKNVMGSLRLL